MAKPGEAVSPQVDAPAGASARAIPPGVAVDLLNATRLAVLGILVSIGLGAAGVALTLDSRGWVGAVAGVVSVVLAGGLLHNGRSRRLLGRFAARVLPTVSG